MWRTWKAARFCHKVTMRNHLIAFLQSLVACHLQGDVEGKGSVRPPWLGFAVHVYNSIAAWGDLLLARPRTFRYGWS